MQNTENEKLVWEAPILILNKIYETEAGWYNLPSYNEGDQVNSSDLVNPS